MSSNDERLLADINYLRRQVEELQSQEAGRGIVVLFEANPSGVASVDEASLRQIEGTLVIEGVLKPANDGVQLDLQLNGVTTATYTWAGMTSSNAHVFNSAQTEIRCSMSNSIGNAAGESITFRIVIPNYSQAISSILQRVLIQSSWLDTGAAPMNASMSGGAGVNTAISQITLKFSAGNITSGWVIGYVISGLSGSGGSAGEKVKVSANDSTAGYLNGKAVAGTAITLTENNDGANETLTFAVNQGAVDHGSIGGLADDDHTQYALLAGRAGGQTLIGGTGSGDDLTLQSTSHATKGDILITDGSRLYVSVPTATTSALILQTTDDSGTNAVMRVLNAAGDNLFNILATGLSTYTFRDAGTNNRPQVLTVRHSTTGIPAANFGDLIVVQADTNGSTNRSQFGIETRWTDATDATRKAQVRLYVYDTTVREAFRTDADGTYAIVSFGGIATVASTLVAMQAPAATYIPQQIYGAAGQSANLLEMLTSGSAILRAFTAAGYDKLMADAITDTAPSDDTTLKKLTLQKLAAPPTNAAYIAFSNNPGTDAFYLVLEEG